MTKAEMRTRLDAALDLLTEATEIKRLPKGAREKFAAFVEETKAIPESGTPGAQIWRLAEVENQKTGRMVTLHVRADGKTVPTDRKRTGVNQAMEWAEVRAESRTEAREKIEAGEGKRFEISGKGKIVEVKA